MEGRHRFKLDNIEGQIGERLRVAMQGKEPFCVAYSLDGDVDIGDLVEATPVQEAAPLIDTPRLVVSDQHGHNGTNILLGTLPATLEPLLATLPTLGQAASCSLEVEGAEVRACHLFHCTKLAVNAQEFEGADPSAGHLGIRR
jgi:hypothetical protein